VRRGAKSVAMLSCDVQRFPLETSLRFITMCYALSAFLGIFKLVVLSDWRAGLSLADLWGVGALEEVETGEFVELHTKKSFVFERGARNVSCYRIPALVQTGKGTLVAFAEARHESCGDDDVHEIAYRRSLNNAYSWTKVAFAVGSATYKVGNPMPVIVKDASRKSGEFILLLYVTHDDQCNKECGTGNAVIKSGDEGKTWSNPLDVSKMFGPASGGLPGPGSAIQTRSGRILVAVHLGKYYRDYVVASDDLGKTWYVTQEFESEPEVDEPTLAELQDGRIHFSGRTMATGRLGRGVAVSYDDGTSFSELQFDCGLRGAVCQGSATVIGPSLFFSGPLSTNRANLVIQRSVDGETWDDTPLLVQKRRSFGYSSMAPFWDGGKPKGAILYEYGPRSTTKIVFRTFPLRWV